jgi:benzil reductase ((S)-benzoin forming)
MEWRAPGAVFSRRGTGMSQLTIITGASRGLGLALAEQHLAPGATVVCISRQTNAALAVHAAQMGATLEQWSLDLQDGAAAAHALSQWLQKQDAAQWEAATLINNAGTLSDMVPLRDAQADDLTRALRVGLEAPMQLCAAFLGSTQCWVMPRKVLNISSGLGRRAMASTSVYCAAKAGLDHFTRCMALDEARDPHGAKVCSLAPGIIDTDMQLQLRSADANGFPDQASFAELHRNHQLSSPQQTARLIVAYLARADFGSKPVADIRD